MRTGEEPVQLIEVWHRSVAQIDPLWPVHALVPSRQRATPPIRMRALGPQPLLHCSPGVVDSAGIKVETCPSL